MNKLICVKISAGLFPNENIARFNTIDGELSVFVSLNQVDEGAKTLNVVLLDEDNKHALLQIPTQSGDVITKVQRNMVK